MSEGLKKWDVANLVLSVGLILMIWVPYTRVFLVGDGLWDVLVGLCSVLTIVLSIYTLKDKITWFRILCLVIGLSPVIFVILALVLYHLHPVP